MNKSLLATHVLDTSVFIQAARIYYPFDICPGFWSCLLYHCQTRQIVILDRVRAEIRRGNDELKEWINDVPRQFFASTKTPEVIVEFSALMQWVQNNDQFMDEAKSEFASVADGWVVAYAKAYDLVVVTQEVYAADVRKRVPIPNVCREFGVTYQDTFAFLRALNARFEWAKP